VTPEGEFNQTRTSKIAPLATGIEDMETKLPSEENGRTPYRANL
jgi:hypothetical protein